MRFKDAAQRGRNEAKGMSRECSLGHLLAIEPLQTVIGCYYKQSGPQSYRSQSKAAAQPSFDNRSK